MSHHRGRLGEKKDGVYRTDSLKRRWVVERTFAWIGRCRIHSRDYERLPESSEAQVQISMIQLMLRRLAKAEYRDPFRYVRPPRKQAV